MIIKKAKKRFRWLWIALPAITFVAGIYLLLLVGTPTLTPPQPNKNWNEPVAAPQLTEPRVYIPRLSLNLKYGTNESALLHGLWHRFPERGDPVKGGNFILAGHRFEMGFTPGETSRQSPLYHLDKIMQNDYIYVDFGGQRYQYQVTRRYKVKPTQIEIEAPSETPILTLYSCTFQGSADGREVVEARLIEKKINPQDALIVAAN